MGNSSEKRSYLSGVVQWGVCVFVLMTCGYSLVRQQRLEQRLKALEDWHLRVEDTPFNFHQSKETALKRETRDVTDCICPSGMSYSTASTKITLQKKWKGIRGCFTRELKRQEKLKAGDFPGPRKSEYTHFQQLQFLRKVVISRDSDEAPDYIYYEVPDFTDIKKEDDDDDPLQEDKYRRAKKAKYEMDDDEDKLFLLSMLSTLQSIPVSKKITTKIKLLTVLEEATRNTDD